MKNKVFILIKKELHEYIVTYRYLAVLTLIILLSLMAGYGGVGGLRIIEWIGAKQSILLGLTNSTSISLREIALVLSPLLAIILSGNIISKEIESRNIIRILSKKVTRKQIFISKTASLLIMLTILSITSASLSLITLQANTGINLSNEETLRFLSFTGTYIIYSALWGELGLTISLIFRKSGRSLIALLIIYIILTPIWVYIPTTIAHMITTDPQKEILLEYNLKMLSPMKIFDEAASFLLNPHYIKISKGEWIYDWQKTIPFSETITQIYKDIAILITTLLTLTTISYLLLKKLQIPPQT